MCGIKTTIVRYCFPYELDEKRRLRFLSNIEQTHRQMILRMQGLLAMRYAHVRYYDELKSYTGSSYKR